MRTCGKCGRELTSLGPMGLCPRCVLAEGVTLDETKPDAPEIGQQSAQTPKLGGERTRPGSSFPRPLGKPGAREIVRDASEPREAQRAGREARPATPEGGCAPQLRSSGSEQGLLAESHPTPEGLGVRVGDYDLLEEIARGGMGIIYKARQRSLDRIVALKRIAGGQLATPQQVKRFRAEAQAVASLQHPNIVAIHEVGEEDGQPYFSMVFVAGRSLADWVRDGPLPARVAARYLQKIAAAVQYAHDCGVIHRDLKPSNVLIDQDDEPRITDFGLAKRLTTHAADLTLSGQVLGSPSYLSPEQARGKGGQVGPASDIYSLGAILYHLLTGRPPFQSESLTTLLKQVLETEPVAPRLLNPSVPRDLETICLKCLAACRT